MLNTVFKDLILGDFDFRNLILQSPMSIIVLHGETFIIKMANKPVLDMLTMEWEEVKGKSLTELLPEPAKHGFMNILKQVYNTGKPYEGVELPILIGRHSGNNKSKTEEVHYINTWINVFSDDKGTPSGLVIVGTDVSELVRSRNASRENEAKYKALFHSMNQGFAITELIFDGKNKPVDYRFLEVNPVFVKITGIANAVGKTAYELVPNLEDYWVRMYGEVALTGESKTFIQHSDAFDITFEVYAFRIGNNSSRKVAMLFTDITERHKSENAQKKFAEKLKAMVEMRTLELEKANADLIHFMHVSSHDLKEPVRKIKTFASFLRNEYHDELSLHADGLLAKILNASDRLNTMIEGVLNYSVSDKSRQDISEIDLGEVIKNIINDLEVVIHHKQVKFKIGDMLHLEGAKVLIYQVFYNIIYNSIKFSKDSVPLTISITSERERHNSRDYVKITFTDNGIGFDQEYAEKIFDPFFRLHSKDHYEGAGLGLALCRKLVERHSGEIYASGKLNEGATITILLPVMQSRNYL